MGAIDHGAFSGLEHLPLRSLVERLRKEARQGWRVNFWQAVCDHLVHAYPGEALSWNQACPIIADLIEADLKEEAGTQPAAGAQVENPLQVEPPRPPAPPIRQPRPKQVQAFWLAQAGKAQQQIAELLSTSQGTVSKWIKHVKRWRDAGNKMPEIPRTEPLDSKPTAMDPAKLDLGPRPDHRPEGQQAKLAEISGHGSQDE
jgi:hypothetical protein